MSAKDDESPHVPNEEELSCDPSDDEYEGGGTRDDRSIGACADASMDMGSPLPGDGCLDFDGITRKVVAVKNALGGDETLMKEINVPGQLPLDLLNSTCNPFDVLTCNLFDVHALPLLHRNRRRGRAECREEFGPQAHHRT
jgi:hypothetical protein